VLRARTRPRRQAKSRTVCQVHEYPPIVIARAHQSGTSFPTPGPDELGSREGDQHYQDSGRRRMAQSAGYHFGADGEWLVSRTLAEAGSGSAPVIATRDCRGFRTLSGAAP